jgi:hypothetical protein
MLADVWEKSQNDEQSKQFVHMLNSTLTATERTLCCILENFQKEDGVEVPKVLQPYMGGIEFLPFKQPLDVKQAADSKSNKSKSKVFICLCRSLFPKQHSKVYFYLIFLGSPFLTGKCCLSWTRNKVQCMRCRSDGQYASLYYFFGWYQYL